jgi:predicted dehydrogenase
MKGLYEINYEEMELPKIGIGVLGYGFMGKVHSKAYRQIPHMFWPPPAIPSLIGICGRDKVRVEDTAKRYGYKGFCTDWHLLIDDPRISIFDNCGPDNVHYEPSVAAAEAGKHVFCEKPLAVSAEDAKKMLDAANKSGVKHMCGYNYRFIPAVRLARELIEKGAVGRIFQFRGRYLQGPGHKPSEPIENVWYASGPRSGVLLGIGCHVVDMARFLVGEIKAVNGLNRTYTRSRPKKSGGYEEVRADEGSVAILEFENGATGTLESSGVSTGRKNQLAWEINGSKGSISFDLEDLNHLHVCLEEASSGEIMGFSNVSVTEPYHPFHSEILPPGHNVGWEYGHLNEIFHFIDAVAGDKPITPYGATFEDGYMVQLVIEAINESSGTGRRIEIESL